MTDLSARDFIQIKTDQFNYEHFISGPQTFTVAKIGQKMDQGKKRLLIHMQGHEATPFIPCMGMIKCLSNPEGWGDKLSDWVGRSITLFGDSNVKFGRDIVGGVRISHISHIPKAYSTIITERRGVRIQYTIEPLGNADRNQPDQPAMYPSDQFDKNFSAWAKAVGDGKLTPDQVVQRASKTGTLSDEQIAAIMSLGQAE